MIYRLKEAGLTTLYVSIPTIDEDAYTKVMGNNILPLLNTLTKIEDKEL